MENRISAMSIEVRGLTKIYGQQKAIDDISFQASPGEILGFLGPNGAGKSTTMKIISCFLEASAGSVTIDGMNTHTHSMEIRRQLGYLPENNPLYGDMYVKEFLGFIADVFNINNKNQRIKDVIEQTGLGPEQHKKIETLSKGYKQRVGIAHVILHDPKMLILDEPTSGLDPTQLVGIRALIAELGKTKTVILSTHIMQEVEALCKRVVIINRGKMVTDSTLHDLHTLHSNESLEEIFIKLTHVPAL